MARVPFVPIIGNHEWYDGDNANRWLNQTNFVPLIDTPNNTTVTLQKVSQKKPVKTATTKPLGWMSELPPHHVSTAHSALGHALVASTWLAMADGSSSRAGRTQQHHVGSGHHNNTEREAETRPQAHPPSNTSRFFSVDLGLGHFIALDSNVYVNADDAMWAQVQLNWLKADLERFVFPVCSFASLFSCVCANVRVCVCVCVCVCWSDYGCSFGLITQCSFDSTIYSLPYVSYLVMQREPYRNAMGNCNGAPPTAHQLGGQRSPCRLVY